MTNRIRIERWMAVASRILCGLLLLLATLPPAAAQVAFGGPIVITRGGTYSGNWQSTDPAIPAVDIRTTERVILERCNLRGPGPLVTGRRADGVAFTGIDLTIRDCRGEGVDPRQPGLARGQFLRLVFPRAVVVENNEIVSTRGITLIGDNTPRNVREIRVLRNRVRNLDGRTSDGARCAATNVDAWVASNGMCGASLVQVNGFLGIPMIRIGWNEMINTPGSSQGEDHISIYNASGTPASPILIYYNYLQGAYPARPASDPFTGSAINAGDSSSTADATQTAAHVRVVGNSVVSVANAGIIVPAGHDIAVTGNRIVSSGRLPDGRAIRSAWVGIYIWDCCYDAVARGAMFNVVATDNVIGFTASDSTGALRRNDTFLPDCSRDAAGASRCVRNVSLPGTIGAVREQAERTRWLQRVAAAGVVIGPRLTP